MFTSLFKEKPGRSCTWIANVSVEKYALGGSGRIVFFFRSDQGDDKPSQDPSIWLTDLNCVGWMAVFADDPELSGCQNCRDQAASRVCIGGTVHLTKALLHRGISITDIPVEFLRQRLCWRICDADEKEIPVENVPSLKVVVQSRSYQLKYVGGRRIETDYGP